MPAGAPLASVTGTLLTVHGHARRGSGAYADIQLVTRRGRTLRLDTRLVRRLPRAGAEVRVLGRLHAGVMRARRVTVLRRRVRARAALASGTYRTLVVPISFASAPSTPWSTATLKSRIFTATDSVRAYLEETSLGAVTLRGVVDPSGDVAAWQTISSSTSTCSWSSWQSAARAAASAAGWSLSSYDRILYVMGTVSACGWSGLAPYPSGGWVHLNGTTRFGVFAHELGHTFGLDHASTLSCTAGGLRVWISTSCTSSEYGDPFDPMGDAWTGRWYHAFSRQRLGWLTPAQAPQATTSGTYTLLPATGGAGGVRALTIPRGDGSSYHLELRRPAGIFDAFAPTDLVVGGISVRLVPTSVNGTALPQLLDTTPLTPTFVDAALAPGREVTDSARKITIQTISAGPSGAQVRLWVGEDPAPHPPSEPDRGRAAWPRRRRSRRLLRSRHRPRRKWWHRRPRPRPRHLGRTRRWGPRAADPPTRAPATTTPPPSGAPATRPAPRLVVSVPATTRRRTVAHGLLVRVRSSLRCPCRTVVELRDSRGRLAGRGEIRATAATRGVRIRLVRSARQRLEEPAAQRHSVYERRSPHRSA